MCMCILVVVLNGPELVECMHTYHYARMHSCYFNAHVLPVFDSIRRVEIRKKKRLRAYVYLYIQNMLHLIHFIFANSMWAFMLNLNNIVFHLNSSTVKPL